MPDRRYSEGKQVPSQFVTRNAPSDLSFAVPVDVYIGYGEQRHVYPREDIETREEILTGSTEYLNDTVTLYTVPYDELR